MSETLRKRLEDPNTKLIFQDEWSVPPGPQQCSTSPEGLRELRNSGNEN